MNNFYLAILFTLVFTGSVVAQTKANITPDQRLYECFDAGYIDHIKNNSPQLLQYLNFSLDNSYYLDEVPTEKDLFYENIPAFDVANFNVFKLNLKKQKSLRTYYRIGNTNKLIVFYSEDEFAKKLNEYTKSLK